MFLYFYATSQRFKIYEFVAQTSDFKAECAEELLAEHSVVGSGFICRIGLKRTKVK